MSIQAASLERNSVAYMTKKHAEWEEEYDNECRKLKGLGFGVVEREFPSINDSGVLDFAAKSDIITMGFLRDFITVEPQLLRELGSYKSEIAMAIDCQHKVVKHAVGNNDVFLQITTRRWRINSRKFGAAKETILFRVLT